MSDAQPVLLIASALIRQGTDVLLVRQRQRGTQQDYWSLPGGVVDPGELLSEAMVREVREESGLEVVDPGRLLYVVQHEKPTYGGPMIDFCFEVAGWLGEVARPDPEEILEARFAPPADAIALLQRAPVPTGMSRSPPTSAVAWTPAHSGSTASSRTVAVSWSAAYRPSIQADR